MSTAALNNLWMYIQGMALSDRSKQWLADRLIESKTSQSVAASKLSVESQRTTRDVARIICTEEEYQRLEAEGFLDNPQPQFGPFTEEDIIREVEEAEKEGYLGAEETAAWLNKLLSL